MGSGSELTREYDSIRPGIPRQESQGLLFQRITRQGLTMEQALAMGKPKPHRPYRKRKCGRKNGKARTAAGKAGK